jgi:hypothetical protein
LPAGKLRDYGGNALRQADWGARLDALDWQALERVQAGGSDLRLPELGPLRVLAEALQVRFRGEAAGRRFADAVRTAKTMFALARHLGEYPAVAANRLGMDVAGLALDTLQELLQQPRCPNLYWALADLPCPLVGLRKGFQGDGVRAAACLRGLRQEPMTAAEVEEVVGRLSGAVSFARQQAGLPPRNLRAALREVAQSPSRLEAAGDRMVKAGCLMMLVAKFPPAQVVLLDEERAYQARRDEELKLLTLTPPQAAGLRGKGPAGGKDLLLAHLLPDVAGARRAQARLGQRLALLRHVEALRLYAAAHAGRLPAKLSDCLVPLPDDPFTGKPFRYEAKGAVAHVRGGPISYEITIDR